MSNQRGTTREAILESAKRLFCSKGYDATSMEDIAKQCNLRKASLYHHFSGKTALAFEIVQKALDPIRSGLRETTERRDIDSKTKLRLAIKCLLVSHDSDPDGISVYLREDRAIGEPYRKEYFASRREIEDLVERVLIEGIESGDLRQVDVSVAAKALLGMTNWTVTWYRIGGRLSIDQIAAQFADLLWVGLGKEIKPTHR